jgi:hypothetical protein
MKFASVRVVLLALVLAAFAILPMRPASGQEKLPQDASSDLPGRPGMGPALTNLHNDESRLEEEARSLVGQYSASKDEGEQAKIRSKLSAVLEKQFDLQEKRRDLEVARLEAQLKKIRELMRKRADARQTIVEKRLDQLLREAQGLGWTAPPALTAPPLFRRAANDLLPELPRSPLR